MRTAGRRLTRMALAASVVTGAACASLHPASAEPVQPPRWLLVYDGDPRFSYDSSRYEAMLTGGAYRSACPDRHPFSGVILLSLKSRSRHWFVHWVDWARADGPTDGSDWEGYLDQLSRPDGVWARLDAAARRAGIRRLQVAVMLPEPGDQAAAFDFLGRNLDLRAQGRAAPVAAYVRELQRRFRQAHLSHLALTAGYWLREDVEGADTTLVRDVARSVHDAGLQFFWIPYYSTASADRWRSFGFDAAWLQPNYFFDPKLPRSRVDSAIARAQRAGMGVELEFDQRLFTDSAFRGRLAPYLAALRARPPMPLSLYDGAGALARLLQQRRPGSAADADALVRLLCRS